MNDKERNPDGLRRRIARFWPWKTGEYLKGAPLERARGAAGKLFSIPASPAIRKFSPIPVTPDRSSASLIRTSETLEPISTMKSPRGRTSSRWWCANFRTWRRIGDRTKSAQDYLAAHNIPVIWDIDTRALVRHLRKVGALRGVVSTDGTPAEQLIAEARALPTMAGLELASRVTCAETYPWAKPIELKFGNWHGIDGSASSRGAALSRGGVRFRHQAKHSAAAGGSPLRCDGRAGADLVRGCAGDEARRSFLSAMVRAIRSRLATRLKRSAN